MKTLIVGMNNPNSGRADTALLPYPRNSAGWRLWKMCHDVSNVSRYTYRQSFEFVNLCDGQVWDVGAARAKYEALESAWAGRRVVLCGLAVLGVLRLARPPAGLLWARTARDLTWCYVPHPSGLCREYNNPLVRLCVGLRLEEEMHRGRPT